MYFVPHPVLCCFICPKRTSISPIWASHNRRLTSRKRQKPTGKKTSPAVLFTLLFTPLYDLGTTKSTLSTNKFSLSTIKPTVLFTFLRPGEHALEVSYDAPYIHFGRLSCSSRRHAKLKTLREVPRASDFTESMGNVPRRKLTLQKKTRVSGNLR